VRKRRHEQYAGKLLTKSELIDAVMVAAEERDTRMEMLARSNNRTDRQILESLANAAKRKPASVGCCPLLARRFQIFFASRGFRIHDSQCGDSERYTLFDLSDAVPCGQLHTIKWKKLHNRLRRRLERILGKNVVAYGMGEVEWDESRGMWQPHYHLVIYNASDAAFRALRKKHYRAKRRGPRPMLRSKPQSLERWLTYMRKLTVFAKSPGEGPGSRIRLSVGLSRQHFRYISRNAPTTFVFAMGCRIVKMKER
jgi:hypothetical protein